jgi:hypothetical protein
MSIARQTTVSLTNTSDAAREAVQNQILAAINRVATSYRPKSYELLTYEERNRIGILESQIDRSIQAGEFSEARKNVEAWERCWFKALTHPALPDPKELACVADRGKMKQPI